MVLLPLLVLHPQLRLTPSLRGELLQLLAIDNCRYTELAKAVRPWRSPLCEHHDLTKTRSFPKWIVATRLSKCAFSPRQGSRPVSAVRSGDPGRLMPEWDRAQGGVSRRARL